jgi:hypothetical protein
VAALDDLRRICLELPEVEERVSHAEPVWSVRRHLFVTFADHHHDDRLAFWCAADREQRDVMVAGSPDRFFVPPYYGVRGWLGVYLDVAVDWDEIGDIVREAYVLIAPARLAASIR